MIDDNQVMLFSKLYSNKPKSTIGDFIYKPKCLRQGVTLMSTTALRGMTLKQRPPIEGGEQKDFPATTHKAFGWKLTELQAGQNRAQLSWKLAFADTVAPWAKSKRKELTSL